LEFNQLHSRTHPQNASAIERQMEEFEKKTKPHMKTK